MVDRFFRVLVATVIPEPNIITCRPMQGQQPKNTTSTRTSLRKYEGQATGLVRQTEPCLAVHE